MSEFRSYPNWFEVTARSHFEKNLTHLKGRRLQVLQLGCFTGDATEWLFKNVLDHPDSVMVDVDTWEDSSATSKWKFDWNDVEQTYLRRHSEKLENGRLQVFKGTSDYFFESQFSKRLFDFIYIDGSHKASDVLRDGINSFHRTNSKGLVAFDDYFWSGGPEKWSSPRPAIDSIAACSADTFVIQDAGQQVWFRKIL